MPSAFASVLRRDDDQVDEGMNKIMFDLMIALLVLFLFALALVGGLLFMRRRRRAREAQSLPMYSDKRASSSSSSMQHRRVTERPSQSIHIYNEKQGLVSSSAPPSPTNAVPEIRVTFPEEYDDSGKRQSGRVVVVHLGEKGVGLEPVQDDLPPYQQDTNDRYESLDLDRVGGLTEKDFEKEHHAADRR